MKSFNFRYHHAGEHTHVTVFAGEKDGTRGNCGSLCMRQDEFLVFMEKLAAKDANGPAEFHFEFTGEVR